MNNIDLILCSGENETGKRMTAKQIALVQKTWKLFRDINPQVIGDVFYTKLFTEVPAVKRLFKSPMTGQYKKLIDMISMIVGRLHEIDAVTGDIKQMAKRHVQYGVRPEHYAAVGAALMWTLQQGLGADWDAEAKEAWETCYQLLATTMMAASGY